MQSPFYVNPDSHKGCRGKKTRSTRLLRQQKQKGGNFSLEVAILQDVWYIVYMGASCEISVADFPWRAEEDLQALVS